MSDISAKSFGRSIKNERQKKNVSQKELAERMCVSISTISSWERGQSMPCIIEMDDLANCLGISVYDLLEGSRNKKSDKNIFDIMGAVTIVLLVGGIITAIALAPKRWGHYEPGNSMLGEVTSTEAGTSREEETGSEPETGIYYGPMDDSIIGEPYIER